MIAPEDRAILHQRIETRYQHMLKQGFVEEVEGFYNRGDLHSELPSMRSVGYRQVWQYLEGATDYEEMLEKGTAATRQFAKRQYTWLRGEEEKSRFEATDLKILSKVLNYLETNAI